MSHLLSLVDGPPLANALVAWHTGAKRVHVLNAAHTRARRHAQELTETLLTKGISVGTSEIDDRAVNATMEAVRDRVDPDWIVDVTGGSRAMGIGAAFGAHARGARVVVFDDATNTLVEPGGAAQPIDVHLTVDDVFALHGRALHSEDTPRQGPTRDAALALYTGAHLDQLGGLLTRIRRWYARGEGEIRYRTGADLPVVERFLAGALAAGHLCAARRGPRSVTILPAPEHSARAFFTGGWLEQYVYEKLRGLQRQGAIDDVRTGVELRWDDDDPTSNRNELDVVCTRRDRLVVVECKSAPDFTRRAEQVRQQLDRLVVLRRALGDVLAEACLVTTGRIPQRARLRRRARDLGVHLFDGPQLADLDRHFDRLATGRALP